MTLPNYTQIPNEFIEAMPKYNGAVVKAFLCVCRKTIGWHKTSDRISFTQLSTLTGLTTKTLQGAMKVLIEDGWISRTKTKIGIVYDLNMSESSVGEVHQKVNTEPEKEDDYGNNYHGAMVIITNTKETPTKERGKSGDDSALAPVNYHASADLANTIRDYFYEQQPEKTVFDFKREVPHCKKLAEKAMKHDDPAGFLKRLVVTFAQMRTKDKFYKSQPMLPSVLNSAGIYARIVRVIENEEETQLTESEAELVGRLFQ
jgi:phage replication O-like protein O